MGTANQIVDMGMRQLRSSDLGELILHNIDVFSVTEFTIN